MFGHFSSAIPLHSYAFVSKISLQEGDVASYRLKKRALPVSGCREIRKKDMKLNTTLPDISVDPETYQVMVDGQVVNISPAERLPLTQLTSLF